MMINPCTPPGLLPKHTAQQTLSGTMTFQAERQEESKLTQYRLTEISSRGLDGWGPSPQQLVGRLLDQLVTEPNISLLSRQFDLVADYGHTVQFEITIQFPEESSTSRFNLGISKVNEAIFVTYVDLSDRSEYPVSKSEQVIETYSSQSAIETNQIQFSQKADLLQQVIDNSQAGLVLAIPIKNTDNQIVDFKYILTNEYNARVTGRTVAEMTGASVGSLFPNWQDSDLFHRYVAVVESGIQQHITFPYESYGMKGWFNGTFTCVDGCILYTYIDVTPLKEAEVTQQQHAELLEQVMNTTPTSIVVHKSIRDESTGEIVDFRMTQLNQVAADLLQYPIELIQHRRISSFFPGLLETPLFDTYKQVVKSGKPARMDVPWGERWYDFSVVRLGDGIVVAVQDITAMHMYRQQLERANLELQRSNENLESFAYIASHDLQEPLRKLSSFADILHNQYAGEFSHDATEIISRINASAIRMRLLIQDVLSYARVGTTDDPFKPLDLMALLSELQTNELWAAIYQTKATIRLEALPTIVADPTQMRQLFQNLLANSIKFCSKGVIPAIVISAREITRSDLPPRLLAHRTENSQKSTEDVFVEIRITDNGIGFDEKYADRIFQVFQRLNGRNRYEGSGIGLAICQKITERHGGGITASSKQGEGSTFRVYLPVRTIM